MKIKKIKEIKLPKSKIFKIFNFYKNSFKIKEIYIVQINGKISRPWRQHMNCKKILLCFKGSFQIEIMKKSKIIKKKLKPNNFIDIPKKTIFKFSGLSKKLNYLIVLSDEQNSLIVSKKNFNF
tara:strand:+ start:771 stop:1139 length:369 start_codon:yes stop_codon:yes gene_type:complete